MPPKKPPPTKAPSASSSSKKPAAENKTKPPAKPPTKPPAKPPAKPPPKPAPSKTPSKAPAKAPSKAPPTKTEKPKSMGSKTQLGLAAINALPGIIGALVPALAPQAPAPAPDTSANDRKQDDDRREQERRAHDLELARIREDGNRASQEAAQNNQMIMLQQMQQESARNQAQQAEARAAEREDRMKSEMNQIRREADAENRRAREDARRMADQQAAQAQQREQEHRQSMENERRRAEEEKERAAQEHQKEMAAQEEKAKLDEKFNKQMLAGVLDQQRAELEDLQAVHRDTGNRMNEELELRSRDLRAVQQTAINAQQKYESVRQEELNNQAIRADAREKQKLSEITSIRNANNEEKKGIMQEMEKRGDQLHKQLESDLAKSWKERENDIKQKEKAIDQGNADRKQVIAMSEVDKQNHRMEMKALSEQHRRDCKELYNKLHSENERYKLEEIDRIAEQTKIKLRIVDTDFAKVKRDAIMTIQRNFCNDFTALQSRVQMVEDAVRGLLEYIDPESEEVPFSLAMLQSEFQSETGLMDFQLNRMRGKLRICMDIPDDFKKALLTPLASYEVSHDKVKSVSIKVMKAIEEKNMFALSPVKESLESHLGVVRETICKMKQLEMKRYVENSLTAAAQKSIQN